MRDCPQCSNPVDGLVCAKCGWRDPAAKATSDPSALLCEHVDRGQRCAHVGTVSPSTVGGGPWYCLAHAPHLGGSFAVRAPTSPHASHVFALAKRYAPKQLDVEQLAERLAIQAEGDA
jgi:hypothetical protein